LRLRVGLVFCHRNRSLVVSPSSSEFAAASA
jgi:hypothetical protein